MADLRHIGTCTKRAPRRPFGYRYNMGTTYYYGAIGTGTMNHWIFVDYMLVKKLSSVDIIISGHHQIYK